MKKIKPVIFILAFLIILVLIESQTKILRRSIDNILYDNYNHYIPCSELPTESYVNGVVSSHQDAINAILDINPGNVGVEVDATTCPGKADLIIWYPSHQDRIAIQEILKDANFFGVPLRLQNR